MMNLIENKTDKRLLTWELEVYPERVNPDNLIRYRTYYITLDSIEKLRKDLLADFEGDDFWKPWDEDEDNIVNTEINSEEDFTTENIIQIVNNYMSSITNICEIPYWLERHLTYNVEDIHIKKNTIPIEVRKTVSFDLTEFKNCKDWNELIKKLLKDSKLSDIINLM